GATIRDQLVRKFVEIYPLTLSDLKQVAPAEARAAFTGHAQQLELILHEQVTQSIRHIYGQLRHELEAMPPIVTPNWTEGLAQAWVHYEEEDVRVDKAWAKGELPTFLSEKLFTTVKAKDGTALNGVAYVHLMFEKIGIVV